MDAAALRTASCHCGAIRIRVRRLPRTLLSCNCSICRRYRALWAYYVPDSVHIEAPRAALARYSWNKRIRNYFRCRRCGCVTHYAYRTRHTRPVIAVNAANFERAALAQARVRHLDGARSWRLRD